MWPEWWPSSAATATERNINNEMRTARSDGNWHSHKWICPSELKETEDVEVVPSNYGYSWFPKKIICSFFPDWLMNSEHWKRRIKSNEIIWSGTMLKRITQFRCFAYNIIYSVAVVNLRHLRYTPLLSQIPHRCELQYFMFLFHIPIAGANMPSR